MKATQKLARVKQAVFDWTATLRHATTTDETVDIDRPESERSPFLRSAEYAEGEAELVGEAEGSIDRVGTIERLLELNPSVQVEFLEQFSDEGLEHYLARLIRARRPRGRDARWVRRNESRAIVSHTRVR